jgi:hypothetical protein
VNYIGNPPIGTWPGDGTPFQLGASIVGPGSKFPLELAFHTLAQQLTANDLLLIHTSNHGGDASAYGEPWLCGYPNFSLVYKASEFGAALAGLPRFRSLIVSMEQCYSGGFMWPVIHNSTANFTSFASAVPANMPSQAGGTFDPWANDWIAALHGAYADGSPLKQSAPAHPAAAEAFAYSSSVHVMGDLPIYNDNPTDSGETQYLG